jgi:hypothetical protein
VQPLQCYGNAAPTVRTTGWSPAISNDCRALLCPLIHQVNLHRQKSRLFSGLMWPSALPVKDLAYMPPSQLPLLKFT